MKGGCFCGFVEYEAKGVPVNETSCHCSICRRVSGAPFVAWFTIAAADYAVLAGEPARFTSSQHGTRTFCPRCGTPLTFQSQRAPNDIDITVCSLDDPEQVPPKDHTRTNSKLSWVHLDDRLPVHAERRG